MDTEGRLERYRDADRWPTEESLAAMLDNQQAAFVAVRNALPALARGGPGRRRPARRGSGRLIYVGAGASGRLAVQDGVELHPTFGWPHERLVYLLAGGEAALVRSVEGAEDDAAAGRADDDGPARRRPADVVVAVAASGTTAFTRAAQAAARAGRRADRRAWPTTPPHRCWPRPRSRSCCTPGPSSSPARPA